MSEDNNKEELRRARREFENAANKLRSLQQREPIYQDGASLELEGAAPYCSFCGKGKNQVKLLAPGNNALICNECVLLALDVVEGENK